MEALSKIFIAALNLLEAEGRAVQRGVLRVWLLLLMTLGASVVAGFGLLALSLGYYWLLLALVPSWTAVLILGATLLAVSGGLIWTVYWMIRMPEPQAKRQRELTGPESEETATTPPATEPRIDVKLAGMRN